MDQVPMNRDFYSSLNRDMLPSANRDRTTGRLISYFPSIYLQNGRWGAYDYCLSTKPSDFQVRDVRYRKIRITQTSLGSTGIWDVDYADGLTNPTFTTIQGGSPVFNGPYVGGFLVEDFKTPTVSSGFRSGGGAALTWKKELLDADDGFASRLLSDSYATLAAITEFRSYEPAPLYILDTACWSMGVLGWKRVPNSFGSSEMLTNQLLSVHATDVGLKYDGMDRGSEAGYFSSPPEIIPPRTQGIPGATASCIVQTPSIVSSSGDARIAGATVATPAFLWNVRISKILVKTSRANYLEYHKTGSAVPAPLNSAQIYCEQNKGIVNEILEPVSASKVLVYTDRYYGAVCFPPFGIENQSWTAIAGIPSCFAPT